MTHADPLHGLNANEIEMVRLLVEGQRPPAGFGTSADLDPEQAALLNAVACLVDGPSHPLASMEPK
jgi:hypothetical protein